MRRALHQPHTQSFTLIELLAVVMVIMLLARLVLGAAGYVQKNMAVTATKSQIAALSVALESYKADWGQYPATAPARISSSGFWESTNNWILYRALSGAGGGKRYLRFPAKQLRVSMASGSTNASGTGPACGGLTNICDAWGMPINYYCSPTTPFGLSNNVYILNPYPVSVNNNNGYTVGGQVNVRSYDLFSYGPDHVTFVVTNLAYGSWNDGPWLLTGFRSSISAIDNITNFKR